MTFNPRQGPVAEEWVGVAPPRTQECAETPGVGGHRCSQGGRQQGRPQTNRATHTASDAQAQDVLQCMLLAHSDSHAHIYTCKTPPHEPMRMRRHPYTCVPLHTYFR